jgi:hypothetical protein
MSCPPPLPRPRRPNRPGGGAPDFSVLIYPRGLRGKPVGASPHRARDTPVTNLETNSATLTLNGSHVFDLTSNTMHDLQKVIDKLVNNSTGAGGTLHGASATVTLPPRL